MTSGNSRTPGVQQLDHASNILLLLLLKKLSTDNLLDIASARVPTDLKLHWAHRLDAPPPGEHCFEKKIRTGQLSKVIMGTRENTKRTCSDGC